MQAYWKLKLKPVEVSPPWLGASVAAVVLVAVGSELHAARTSRKIPIRTGIVNFPNFLI
jgi:hypothetical protein